MRAIHQIKCTLYCVLLAGLLAAEAAGCQTTDQTRTIVLPPAENADTNGERIAVSRIREYTCEDSLDSLMFPAFGTPGGSLLYLLRRQTDGLLLCTTVDMERDAALSNIFVDTDKIAAYDVCFSPGGKYFSYERISGDSSQLVLFSMEVESFLVLCDIDMDKEHYNYVWSDDGTCLFSWQSGDVYDPYMNWQVTRYQISDGPDGMPVAQKLQFEMKGGGYAVRSVLPNADGSEAYVREEFNPYIADADLEKLGLDRNQYDSSEGYTGGAAKAGVGAGTEPLPANNWLIRLDDQIMFSVEEYSETTAWPIKYTPAGLFVREDDGALCLIEDIGGQQKRTELFQTDGMDICVCKNGDHVFLAEWINASTYQVSGARISDGEASGRQILYRNTFDTIDRIWVEGDEMVMFYSLKYQEADKESRYHLKIVSLEY